MLKKISPIVLASFIAAGIWTAASASPPPSPSTPVAVDPAPLALPPAPGAQNMPGAATAAPAASPAPAASNDPFNPLSGAPAANAGASAPIPVMPSAPPVTATTVPGAPAPAAAAAPGNFDPFANAAATAPTPVMPVTPPADAAAAAAPSPAAGVPLAVPNSPLTIPPPAVAPTGDNLVPVTPYGTTGMPPGPEAAPPAAPPVTIAAEQPKPKPKPKPKFKPNLAQGKKAFDKGQYDTAKKHLQPFAKKGNAEAQYLMGVIASSDKGKSRDYQAAAEWYDKAAAQGVKEAQFNLGFMLYQGAGSPGDPKSVATDYAMAAKYLSAAAQQNVPMAQHLLSLLYMRGVGVPANMSDALRWASAAGDNGIEEAMFNAAMMSVRRPGATMQDYVNSYKWFTILAAKGYPGAMENRNLIVKYMPTNAVQYAEGLARSWRPPVGSNQNTLPDMGAAPQSSATPPNYYYNGQAPANSGWSMNNPAGQPQVAQPMANPNAWPWPQGSNEATPRPHPYPEINERAKYMLSN